MRSVQRRRIYGILGLGVSILALAAVTARVRLSAIDSELSSSSAATARLIELARLRALLLPPAAARAEEGRGERRATDLGVPDPVARALRGELEGIETRLGRIRTLVPAAAPATAGSDSSGMAPARDASVAQRIALAEVEGMAPLASGDRVALDRLDRLAASVRRRLDAAADGRTDIQSAVDAEIGTLLDQLETDERAQAARRLSSQRVDELTRIAVAAAIGFAALLAALLSGALVRWEVERRRRTRRTVLELIASRRALAARMEQMGRVDAVTGLPNRQALIELLERRLRAARTPTSIAVVVADVNRLKQLNSMFGFDGGDEALRQIAERLRSALDGDDAAARIGGGEFAVVHACARGAAEAAAFAEKVQHALAGEVRIAGQEFVVTSNAGSAVHPDHGTDARTLLGNAELALIRAARVGRNVAQAFDGEATHTISDTFVLERRLSAALKNREYLVHYQPYCGLETGELMGVEALLKWRSDGRDVLPASRFVPVLEETGMILDVGRWVLETSCGQVHDWEVRAHGVPVSVNLSVVQFRDRRLAATVAEAIGAFKLDPHHLTLEVTESTCLQDMDFAIRTLRSLKDLGVSISIDDFGTGYSSLSYLRKLPADNVKIDISFVRDVAKDQDAASIVTAITSLARSLDLKTIAEGVETEDQRKILHLLRCDMGQGFLFSPAVPAGDLDRLFRGPGQHFATA